MVQIRKAMAPSMANATGQITTGALVNEVAMPPTEQKISAAIALRNPWSTNNVRRPTTAAVSRLPRAINPNRRGIIIHIGQAGLWIVTPRRLLTRLHFKYAGVRRCVACQWKLDHMEGRRDAHQRNRVPDDWPKRGCKARSAFYATASVATVKVCTQFRASVLATQKASPIPTTGGPAVHLPSA